jgi:hypothetical protein
MKMLAAVKLYALGRLTSSRAADLAGSSRAEFLLSLGRYEVFPLEDEWVEHEVGRRRTHGAVLVPDERVRPAMERHRAAAS